MDRTQLNKQELDLFYCRRLPARLTLDQAAVMLGIHSDGMDYLGGAPRGVQRLFAAVYIEQLAQDPKWLTKATVKIRLFNQQRNLARKKPSELMLETSRI